MHGMAPTDTARTGTLPATTARPRVVILGAGFGGLNAAQALKSRAGRCHGDRSAQLSSVPAAALPGGDRRPFAGTDRDADPAHPCPAEECHRAHGSGHGCRSRSPRRHHPRSGEVPYDYLIVATGARHAYFGHDEWEAFAPGLKKIDEATEIRTPHPLGLRARRGDRRRSGAAAAPDLCRRSARGPTGVEMAGAIAELAKMGIARDFRNIDPRKTEILLIEAGPRILTTFPESLSLSAERQLAGRGVELIKNEAVVAVDAEGIILKNGRRIEAATLIWAAGVVASPAAKWLEAPADRAGRVIVDAHLRLPEHPDVFVIGDTAAVTDAAGRVAPGIAPAAKQMGRFAAQEIIADDRRASRPASSSIATTAISPRSAARRRLPILAASVFPAFPRGSCGASRMSGS